MLNPDQRSQLLAFARRVISSHLHSESYEVPEDAAFQQKCGLFVTLHKGGNLRGCIGYIKGYKSITQSIRELAMAAAFRDPRFPPLKASELPDVTIEMSLLSPMEQVHDISEITIGRDGLYLEHPRSSGLLLPQVATEQRWDRDTFLQQVCRKAGLPESSWQDEDAQLYRFSAEIFGE
jgi:AmmeMemoRadiSam system protein A